jgi:hypothetical protein
MAFQKRLTYFTAKRTAGYINGMYVLQGQYKGCYYGTGPCPRS